MDVAKECLSTLEAVEKKLADQQDYRSAAKISAARKVLQQSWSNYEDLREKEKAASRQGEYAGAGSLKDQADAEAKEAEKLVLIPVIGGAPDVRLKSLHPEILALNVGKQNQGGEHGKHGDHRTSWNYSLLAREQSPHRL